MKKNEKPNKLTMNKLALELNITTKEINKWFKAHKQCTIYYHNCNKYKDQIKNGKLNGKGIFIKNNFDKYICNWLNNNDHGKGIYIYSNGKKFEGEFKRDERNRDGILYKSNGEIQYKGDWLNNNFHGKGTLYFSNGWMVILMVKVLKHGLIVYISEIGLIAKKMERNFNLC